MINAPQCQKIMQNALTNVDVAVQIAPCPSQGQNASLDLQIDNKRNGNIYDVEALVWTYGKKLSINGNDDELLITPVIANQWKPQTLSLSPRQPATDEVLVATIEFTDSVQLISPGIARQREARDISVTLPVK